MGQRNMPHNNQIIQLEMDHEAYGHLHPEPSVLYGSVPNFPSPNIHTVLPAPLNTANFDVHRVLDHRDSAAFYGMAQFNGVQLHQPAAALDLAVATASNHFTHYMTPTPTSRVSPIPLNHGPPDQLPFPGNNGLYGVSAYTYGRNNHMVDGLRSSYKRQNAEGTSSGNFQYHVATACPSAAVAPMGARSQESDVGASFALPEYRVNDMPSQRNSSSSIVPDSVVTHNTNHIAQGNYVGQPFQMAGTPWVDPPFIMNGSDIGTFTWNQMPSLPYMHGSINAGGMEAGNMGVQGYQVLAGNGSSASFLHHPPIPQGHPIHHHPPPPPPPMQRVRSKNFDFHSQGAPSSHRLSTNSTSHTSTTPFQHDAEAAPRFVGPVPSTGVRIYWPHGREAMPAADSWQHNLPHLRVLPEDGVALLEIPSYHEVADFIDHHRDMRLDIDHMSYEELLALGERIGSVGTGLLEENIVSYLRTRTFVSSTTCSNREGAEQVDQTDFCVICQADFQDQEKIGSLDCGHEYHVDCIKKWLLVKNTCPICKSSGMSTERKG